MSKVTMPTFITKYFWGDNLEELNFDTNRKYVVKTLLEKGDQTALQWLFTLLNRKEIKQLLSSLRLDKKSAHFWNIYLS